MSNQTMTAAEAAKWSRAWAVEFGDHHADLLTCFPSQRVADVLLAMAATEKKENEVCEYEDIARWFLNAIDRKLLVPDFPLTGLADEQLQELRAKFGPKAPAAPTQPAVPVASPADSGKRFVRVDLHRFVSSVSHGSISCTNDPNQALLMSAADAQILVARLRRGHNPQAEVVEPPATEAPMPTASDVAGAFDYSHMSRAQFDAFSSRDSRRLYDTNASFRKRADELFASEAADAAAKTQELQSKARAARAAEVLAPGGVK